MKKMDKKIMVVPTKKLFSPGYFEGFTHHSKTNYEDVILNNFEYMRRGDAEENPDFKQPIGYAMIVNPEENTLFSYVRCPKGATETRLHSKWSCGIGGHIDLEDNNETNPLHSSMKRELNEEIRIDTIISIDVLGYINYDQDDVGKVHFGVLYLVKTSDINVSPNAPEIAQGEMFKISDLQRRLTHKDFNIEDWSRIAIEALGNNQ